MNSRCIFIVIIVISYNTYARKRVGPRGYSGEGGGGQTERLTAENELSFGRMLQDYPRLAFKTYIYINVIINYIPIRYCTQSIRISSVKKQYFVSQKKIYRYRY